MRNLLLNFLFLIMMVVCYLGFKYYHIITYEPYKLNLTEDNPVTIDTTNLISNYTLENLSFYLSDINYKTSDFGETFTIIENGTIMPSNGNAATETYGNVSGSNEIIVAEDNSTSNIENPNENNAIANIFSNTDMGEDDEITFQIKHNIIQNVCREDSKLETVEYKDLMKYSKLYNEIDLIKYYIHNKDTDLNPFNFIYEIKTLYLSSVFVKKLDISNNIIFLDGLTGYIQKKNNKTVVCLFNNGNLYEITFGSNYDMNTITNILGTFQFH